jgi:hypothetical protein
LALPRFVVWRRIDVADSFGFAVFGEIGDRGPWIDAIEAVADHRRRYAMCLSISADPSWRTESVFINLIGARRRTSLTIERATDGWAVDGRRRRALEGCSEIDVAASPVTNTLPIRSLGLEVGGERAIRVAWIDVPSLRVVPVEQTYRRLGPVVGRPGVEAWEYSDHAHGSHRLTVDEDGVVIDYAGLAERIGRRRA